MKIISLLLLVCLSSSPLRAELVNVAGRGLAYSTDPLWPPGNWNIHKLTDGDTAGVFHLDVAPGPEAAYEIDLGKAYPVQEIRILPRQDSCCPERLRQIRVSVHKDLFDLAGEEIWGVNLFTDGSNAGNGAGKVVTVKLPSPQTGRWVRIKSLENPVQDYALQLTEVQVFAEVPANDVNRALGTLATSNRALWAGRSPAALVDGNRSTQAGQVIHGLENIEAPFHYDINLGAAVRLSRIVLWPRQDACCADRLANFRVSVHQDNGGKIGSAVWKADLHTAGTFIASDPGTRETVLANLDPSGKFEGQWIRIESLDTPVRNYALQLSEVEAFGEPVGAASLLLTTHPRDAAAAAGAAVTFTAAANIPGGDAAKITYQWQKNGVDIPGATQASHTTPPVLLADDKAKYRVVVSAPGLASQTSHEATLRINLAFQAQTFSNRPLWAPGGWSIDKLVNGNRGDVFHLDTEPQTGAAYEVNLGAAVQFEEILIWARQDGCCPGRLTNFRVSLHGDDNGKIGGQVWSADYFTDGTNPGASAGSVVRITAEQNRSGKFEAQWIRIASLEDPIQNYALQMTELEVYGRFLSQAAILSFVQEPQDFGTAPGRAARFTVTPKVLNGDPTAVAFQWQKNGVNIPGATTNVYQTPPITDADLSNKYRVILSHPAAASVTSREAGITFDYNYAKGQPATTSQPLWGPGGWNIRMLTDGNRRAVFHLDVAPAIAAAYEVDLGLDVKIEKIDLYPRQDGCCPERFTNLRVSVHSDDNGKIGPAVWKTDLFADGTNPGSQAELVVSLDAALDPAGKFEGRWVRITTLENPVQNYALQMTELEVIGRPARPIQVPVSLSYLRSGASVQLTWASGTLEAADSVAGPYSPVANASSPFNVSLQSQQRFFRVRQ